MPFINNKVKSKKWRILISGFTNTGKTTSFSTFMYGPYDAWSNSLEEQEAAVSYAQLLEEYGKAREAFIYFRRAFESQQLQRR